MFKSISLAVIATLATTSAFAGASGQHSAQSVDHGVHSGGHSSAAVSTGTAVVIAVPIIVFGSAVTISGAALETVGHGAVAVGDDLSRAATTVPAGEPVVRPDRAPTLD